MAEPANLKDATFDQLLNIINFRQARANALQREAAQAQRFADRARKALKRRKRYMTGMEVPHG